MDYILVAIIGGLLALMGMLAMMKRKSKVQTTIQSHSSILEMRSVGELVVFRVVTSGEQHLIGDAGGAPRLEEVPFTPEGRVTQAQNGHTQPRSP